MSSKTLLEESSAGQRAVRFPKAKIHPSQKLPKNLLRQAALKLPELTELDVVRHFTKASQLNYSLDTNFYPLGSCTMKYNPKICLKMALHPALSNIHPETPNWAIQGLLALLRELEKNLLEITGMDALTLAPAAGAHAELAAILMTNGYFRDKGEKERKRVIVPDSAHGTNPASASLGGLEVLAIRSNNLSRIDIGALSNTLDEQTALVMVTHPNTLGLFEEEILEIARLVHKAGALLYMDGANMNALMGLIKPGEFGVDLMHLNLHKTFSVPHGGGGPGAGVLLVKKTLEEFLPLPRIIEDNGSYRFLNSAPKSIGRIRSFFGSTANLLWCACYLALLGPEGTKEISRQAILKANYLRVLLKQAGLTPWQDEPCMHECVFTLDPKKLNGVRTLDLAKRLLDYGFYAPTIYFPLIVPEAIMIEPTETEKLETLEEFAKAVGKILLQAKETPDLLKHAPHNLSVKRLDELTAARNPVLRWQEK